ncbi:MAG TPA: hypothetical protein VGB53_03320, partial [Rubricoccaceae bacterium]
MTRAAILLAVAILAGCAAPRPATSVAAATAATGSTDGFDASDWLARAQAFGGLVNRADLPFEVTFDTTETEESAAHRDMSAKRLAAELGVAVGWNRAWDSETRREVDDLTALRGTYTIYPIASNEAVVDVTCNFGVYRGSYALVHINGRRATLLWSERVAMDGGPYGPSSPIYPAVTFLGGRTFETFAAAQERGGCGLISRYQIRGFGEAELVEARARQCDT